jgi:hypothetical protein
MNRAEGSVFLSGSPAGAGRHFYKPDPLGSFPSASQNEKGTGFGSLPVLCGGFRSCGGLFGFLLSLFPEIDGRKVSSADVKQHESGDENKNQAGTGRAFDAEARVKEESGACGVEMEMEYGLTMPLLGRPKMMFWVKFQSVCMNIAAHRDR